jgi:hypothetical protein
VEALYHDAPGIRRPPTGIYSMWALAYMSLNELRLIVGRRGSAMRAEAEKLAEAIRQSLALLRRHL